MEEEIDARILLVDDETSFLETLSSRLKLRGMTVDTVENGEKAVVEAKQQDFDVIIVDLSMPGIDGVETLKQIKANDPNAEVIMLTGQASIQSSIDAMKAGAEDFLQKPIDLTVLMTKISAAKAKKMLILQKKSQDEVKKILKSKSW